MKKTPNDVPVSVLVGNGEQALAEASINLHRALFVVKTFFPDMATDRLLLITGAIVHAASNGVGSKTSVKVKLGEPFGEVTEVAPKSRSPRVKKTRAIKEEAPTPFRLAVLRVVGTQTLSVREV